MPSFKSIDPTKLPKHFEAKEVEARLDAFWEKEGVYAYDPSRPREETFVVDTPPPTVSGSLHVGHVFSFTQTDVLARYRRATGKNVYYPMGWDDNGLPTERRVQNHYHVRVDIRAPYEKGLALEPASNEKVKKEPPRSVSRPNFIELCHEVTREDERAFMGLFRRLGLSVDWREQYATIDDRCRRYAQLSFRDLHEKGHVYSVEAPTMWDVDFQTAIAQAEVEDRQQAGAMHSIAFAVKDSGEHFVIATSRPELLPACVAVAAHPEDERYKHLFGKTAVTPIYRAPVPIFASELVEKDKGTGILMICTFGDATDVIWWREQKLPLRQLIGKNGRLQAIKFGEEPFPSLDADKANHAYQEIAGKNVKQARAAVVAQLRIPEHASAPSAGAPLQAEPQPIERAVKFFEKGDQPLELVSTRQWFVRLLDKKDALLAAGAEVKWHPAFMGLRYSTWTEGLQLDWCVSRQRYFGVQFPVWYRLDAEGAPDYDHPIISAPEKMPVDPTVDVPPGYEESQRGKPNGFSGESDVFDTWFTSSLTPQIGSHWLDEPGRHARLFPADIRPQSHEIIRTWAFYTIVKAMLHEGKIPWHHVLVSGWILDPDRKKMSKSRGNVVTPMHLLDEYSSDAVRYWASSARLGIDTAFDEKVFGIGKRLVTKIFNAAKFVLAQTADVHPISHELDRAFVASLRAVVDEATRSHEEFDYAGALSATEQFFWGTFTDVYIELVKARARGDGATPEERGSAVATLRLALSVLLRLFAPSIPYVTDEVWSWCFAEETGKASIHAARWPGAPDFASIAAPDSAKSLAVAAATQAAVNKQKSQLGASVGRVATDLRLVANASTLADLRRVIDDVKSAVRAPATTLGEKASLEDGAVEVDAITLEPAAPKS